MGSIVYNLSLSFVAKKDMIEADKQVVMKCEGGSQMGLHNIGIPGLFLILIIALIVFGPGKLPGVGKALGESIHGFKKGIAGDDEVEQKNKEVQ